MKQILFSIALLFFVSQLTFSQGKPYAIGLRFAGGNGFGSEISYQHTKSDVNRIEADLGLNSSDIQSSFSLVGTYQWVKPLQGNFNWYIGPGIAIGSWGYRNNYSGTKSEGTFLSIVGILGLEYIFPDAPLQISIDARPSIPLMNGYRTFGNSNALSIRYIF